jgi:nucleotide-binding universal stress UspA family protein
MAIYKKILIAFDGSECCKRAAERGLELAVDQKADVIGIKVIDFIGDLIAPSDALWARIRDDVHKKAEALLGELESMAKQKGVALKPVIREGTAVREIITQADESGVDLIVMGIRGRSSGKHLGNNARLTLSDAKCPIMLVC